MSEWVVDTLFTGSKRLSDCISPYAASTRSWALALVASSTLNMPQLLHPTPCNLHNEIERPRSVARRYTANRSILNGDKVLTSRVAQSIASRSLR